MKLEVGFTGVNIEGLEYEVIGTSDESTYIVKLCDGTIRKSISKARAISGNFKKLPALRGKDAEVSLGQRFGKLTVISLDNPVEPKVSCACGKVLFVKRNPLIRGRATSCGCSPVESSSDKYWKKFQEFMASWDPYAHKPSVKKLPLFEFKRGSVDFVRIRAFSYVDTDFYEYWKNYPFTITGAGYASLANNRYVYDKLIGKRRKGLKYQYKLHHLVRGHTNFQEYVVDHINGCKLDNRFENLRTATILENSRNQHKIKTKVTSSIYKGVCFVPARVGHSKKGKDKPWKAYITWDNGKRSIQRYCETEIEASLKYNEFATEIFGEFAKLNIIKAS